MKKLVSVILVAVMLVSAMSVAAFAEESDTQKQLLYKDKFADYVKFPEYSDELMEYSTYFYDYDELYYHKDAASGEVDWALITAKSNIPPDPWEVVDVCQFGNRLIRWLYPGISFLPYGLAVYNAEEDTFYSIGAVKLKDYEGLDIALEELNIGHSLGDVNLDSTIDILDATEIQLYLAEIKEIPDDNYLYIPAIADVKVDSFMDIMDATAIQMKLAEIELPPIYNEDMVYADYKRVYTLEVSVEEIDFEPLYDGTLGDAGDKTESEKFAAIIKSKEQYDSLFNSDFGMSEYLSDEFFEEKWLVASGYMMPADNEKYIIKVLGIKGSTMYIYGSTTKNSPYGKEPTDLSKYYSFVALDKELLAPITQIVWW